jgi:DNA-3-methyladenine glycosylase II
LLQAIVGQQISTKAAASVWKRLVELLEPEVTAHQLNTFTREEIQACGLSWRKVDYALGLSAAIVSGQLDFDLLEQSDDDAATKMITTLKGFGPWSAEIYLMFAEGRRDICPSADLAIQIGYQRLKNLKEKPTAKELITFLEPWRPHRSAGCLFLWHLYGSTSLD